MEGLRMTLYYSYCIAMYLVRRPHSINNWSQSLHVFTCPAILLPLITPSSASPSALDSKETIWYQKTISSIIFRPIWQTLPHSHYKGVIIYASIMRENWMSNVIEFAWRLCKSYKWLSDYISNRVVNDKSLMIYQIMMGLNSQV